MECKNNLSVPYIINEYDDIYFIYKPPYWNCITYQAYSNIKRMEAARKPGDPELHKNFRHLILDWIKDNLKLAPEINNELYRYGLLNRIDLETSGILMVAKNMDSFNKYRQQINDHIKTTKIYITLVAGAVKERFGVIRIPLFKVQRAKDSITVVDERKGRPTYTEFAKLREYEYEGKIYTLLLIKIKTGITHQIRVHMTTKNTHVVCDNKYEPKKTLASSCRLAPRLFLHAYFYEVAENVSGTACLAADLQQTLRKMKLVKQYKSFKKALALLKETKLTGKDISKTTEATTLDTTLLGHKKSTTSKGRTTGNKTKKSRVSRSADTEPIETVY
jgi:23S rRNA-/tRNA-specific pseudouridylate synthase